MVDTKAGASKSSKATVGSQPPVDTASKPSRDLKLRSTQEVADSWEDEEVSEEEEQPGDSEDPAVEIEDFEDDSNFKSSSSRPIPVAARPQRRAADLAFAPDGTPLSPQLTAGTAAPPNTPSFRAGGRATPISDLDGAGSRVRPEKTVAPAARMIAGALGVKAPKKTDEQRAYDAAVRKRELKKREEEKDQARRRELEHQQAKDEMWDG